MKKRVPASEKTRKRIEALISGNADTALDGSELVKLAAELIIEEALEGEVEELLSREYYARGGGSGHRNGYRRGKLDTAEGRVEYAVPQVRGIERWRSAVRSALGGRSEELERLAIEMYARGLSVRDIEAAFRDDRGQCVLTKSAVSAVTERLWEDYQAFASRELFGYSVAYLFVDGVAERLRTRLEQLEVTLDDGRTVRLTGSFGVSIFPKDGNSFGALLDTADKNLYKAKEGGRNRVVLE